MLSRKRTIIAVCALFGLGFSCVISTQQPAGSLTMQRADALSDTVSTYPRFLLAFSQPLSNASVELVFNPPVPDVYAAYLNASRDTLTIDVTGMLEGATRYEIRSSHPLIAETGAALSEAGSMMTFDTYPRESGQNASQATADTLVTRMCGMLSLGSDTDWYCAKEIPRGYIAISCRGSTCGISITDSAGTTIASGQTSRHDVLSVPDSLVPPFFIRIYERFITGSARYTISAVDSLGVE